MIIDIELSTEMLLSVSPGYTFQCGCKIVDIKDTNIASMILCDEHKKTMGEKLKENIIMRSKQNREN